MGLNSFTLAKTIASPAIVNRPKSWPPIRPKSSPPISTPLDFASPKRGQKMEEGVAGDSARGTIATWTDRHRLMYDQATRHPFILSIRDGTVDIAAFKRWLVSS